MIDAMSSAGKILTTICDTVQVIESFDRMFQAQDAGRDDILEKACLVNKLVCLGFTIAEIGMLISGKKSESIQTLKAIELVPRMFQMLTSPVLEILKTDGSLKSIIRAISRGVIAPMADLARVGSEMICYDEHKYLQLSPEELKTAKRPIYELQGSGEDAVWVIVGYRPVDIEECKANLAEAKMVSEVAATVRIFSEFDILEKSFCDVGIPLYQRLINFLGDPNVVPNPTPAAHHAGYQYVAPQHVAPQHPIQQHAAPQHPVPQHEVPGLYELDLQRFTFIPLPLHDDILFQRFVCPISQEPIRDPVRDPTNIHLNGGTLYERRAILRWLQLHQVSPMTHQPLFANQLIPAPALKAVIDARLEHHRQQVSAYLQQHLNDPITAVDQAIIDQG